MALPVGQFALHLGQENSKGITQEEKKEKKAMGTTHHPRGELQMFPSPAQQPLGY